MKDLIQEAAEIQTLLNKKSCGFLHKKVTLDNGKRAFQRWYFPFSEMLDKPSDLRVGTQVTFTVDPNVEVPAGRYPIARNIEIVSQPAKEPAVSTPQAEVR